jgi:hypothetical protein
VICQHAVAVTDPVRFPYEPHVLDAVGVGGEVVCMLKSAPDLLGGPVGIVGIEVMEVLVLESVEIVLEGPAVLVVDTWQAPEIRSSAGWRKEGEQELWMHDLVFGENLLHE